MLEPSTQETWRVNLLDSIPWYCLRLKAPSYTSSIDWPAVSGRDYLLSSQFMILLDDFRDHRRVSDLQTIYRPVVYCLQRTAGAFSVRFSDPIGTRLPAGLYPRSRGYIDKEGATERLRFDHYRLCGQSCNVYRETPFSQRLSS